MQINLDKSSGSDSKAANSFKVIPWLELVPTYAVLVLGGRGVGNAIRDVAHAYGFKQVIIDTDLVTTHRTSTRFMSTLIHRIKSTHSLSQPIP